MDNDKLKPFILLSSKGRVLEVIKTNEKGYRKSMENRRIWAVDSETGRLLPHNDEYRPLSFRINPDWYEAVIGGGEDMPQAEPQAAPAAGGDSAAGRGRDAAAPGHAGHTGQAVLEDLYELIQGRKREKPEGSYTTHLFSEGISKIKKKTGEEAVELLLAGSREEVIYETADLFYHLLVMLVEMEIGLDEIFAELKSR